MGVTASTSVSKTDNQIITKSVATCKKASVSNELYLQGITQDPAPSCKNPTFMVSQSATVDADCFINALQTNMADAISKLKTGAQGGFGITAATNVNEASQKISASLETTCGGVSATQVINAKDITSRACDMVFIQNANAKSKCKIDALQDNAIKTDNALTTDATGASIGSLLFGSGSSIIVYAIAFVIIIGGLGTIAYYVSKSKKDQDGGCSGMKASHKQAIGLVALVALLLYVVAKYFGWNGYESMGSGDLLKFNRTYNEAQAVAKIHEDIRSSMNTDTPVRIEGNTGDRSWPSYASYEKAGGLHDKGLNLFPTHYGTGMSHDANLDNYFKTFY